MEIHFDPEVPHGSDEQQILSLGVNYLRLFTLLTQSWEAYQAIKETPIPFLTDRGYYNNGIYFPGVGMKIPKHTTVWFSAQTSFPWVLVCEPLESEERRIKHQSINKIENGGVILWEFLKLLDEDGSTILDQLTDLIKTSFTGPHASPIKFWEKVFGISQDFNFLGGERKVEPKLHEKVPVNNMGRVVYGLLEGPNIAVVLRRDFDPKAGNYRETGIAGYYSLNTFSGLKLDPKMTSLERPASEYDIYLLLPDWTAYYDQLTTIDFQPSDIGDDAGDQLVASTC
ncbi:MAG: hypothetical protein AAF998_22500 [Bacteroidota bacterium]